MPFEVLECEARPTTATTGSISYERQKTKHGRAARPKLVISIPTALATGLGEVKDKDRFVFLLGSGEDAGKARIARANGNAEGIKPSHMKWCIKFNFGYIPLLGMDAAAKERMTVRTNNGGFEFDVPSWFKGEQDE